MIHRQNPQRNDVYQSSEGLHPEEAKILCLIKDKALQTKYKITYDVVSEAYPDITWGGRS